MVKNAHNMGKRKCFVIMSFKQEFNNVYELGIKKAATDLKFDCLRIDEQFKPKSITHQIVRDLIFSDVIIADVTETNPNVFYELGISHSIGNKTIIISQNLNQLPFDIRNEFAIEYENTPQGIQLLKFKLIECINKLLIISQDEPTNIVQEAGREFFDFRRTVYTNLKNLIRERERIQEYQKYLSSNRITDNSEVVIILAKNIIKRQRESIGPFFIGICGAAGLGKTTLSEQIAKEIENISSNVSVGILPTDAYLMNRAERLLHNLSGYDPKATNIEKLHDAVQALSKKEKITFFKYNHFKGFHEEVESSLSNSDIIIIDGIHALNPRILRFLKCKIFIYSTRPDIKELRFLTDIMDRGYTVHEAFQHAEDEYNGYENHILHYIKFAEIIIEIDNYWKYKIS